MKVLLKNVILNSSTSSSTATSIFIDNGIITQINDVIEQKADTVIEQKDLHCSIGWMDGFANFCDPGNGHRQLAGPGRRRRKAHPHDPPARPRSEPRAGAGGLKSSCPSLFPLVSSEVETRRAAFEPCATSLDDARDERGR